MFRKLGMFDRSLGMFQPPGSIPYPGPQSLFANGEQGVWYDPSDWTTLFQDSAGTTPVTAIEQPVGLILDKSGRGNHASQSTTTSRPTLRNLYNILQYTEQFDNAYWTKSNLTLSADATVAPDGTTTAELIYPTTSGSNRRVINVSAALTLTATSYTTSVYVKSAGLSWVMLTGAKASSTNDFAWFNVSTGSKGTIGTNITASSIESVGNGWYKLTIACLGASTATNYFILTLTDADNSTSVTANGTDGVYIWGASLVSTNEASLPYQRVVTNTLGSGVYNTDLTKFKPYLAFDGTDDWLQTTNINFSATNQMSVFAGARKLSDAALGVVTELSDTIASNNGAFLLSAPNSAAANYNFSSKGTSQVDNTVTTYAAPITNVVTGLANISAPSNTIRVNGTATAVTTSQGTGNYGSAYPLYVGRRGGTASPFNGRIYSLIIRGALTSFPQLDQTEAWVNSKTGAY